MENARKLNPARGRLRKELQMYTPASPFADGGTGPAPVARVLHLPIPGRWLSRVMPHPATVCFLLSLGLTMLLRFCLRFSPRSPLI
jgi:hypothetical protein